MKPKIEKLREKNKCLREEIKYKEESINNLRSKSMLLELKLNHALDRLKYSAAGYYDSSINDGTLQDRIQLSCAKTLAEIGKMR